MEKEDPIWVDGLKVELPSVNAPEFVKEGKFINMVVFKNKFIDWLKAQDSDVVNIQIKESATKTDEEGRKKVYAQLNTWEPSVNVKEEAAKIKEEINNEVEEDDIPF